MLCGNVSRICCELSYGRLVWNRPYARACVHCEWFYIVAYLTIVSCSVVAGDLIYGSDLSLYNDAQNVVRPTGSWPRSVAATLIRFSGRCELNCAQTPSSNVHCRRQPLTGESAQQSCIRFPPQIIRFVFGTLVRSPLERLSQTG